MFTFSPKQLSKARKYLLNGNGRKKKKPQGNYSQVDSKFARMVSEEKQIEPLKIPETIASKPRRIKIVKWYNR